MSHLSANDPRTDRVARPNTSGDVSRTRGGSHLSAIVGGALLLGTSVCALAGGLVPQDIYTLRSVEDVQAAPAGDRIAYSIRYNDSPDWAYSRAYVRELATGRDIELDASASNVRWSRDGKRIAYIGRVGERRGLIVATADGSDATFVAELRNTNHQLPDVGERLAWSPDGTRIAYVSATDGPEPPIGGDPIVITRYLYKTWDAGSLNDNRRLHIFVVDLATRVVTQLTDGTHYEHSIDWSPRGDEIAYVSNVEPDPDRRHNYDLFVVHADDRTVRRLTTTAGSEYAPRWSPSGDALAYLATTRALTSSESNMEDTHVWTIAADGTRAHDLGARIDNRQESLQWSPDGRSIFATVAQRGSVALYRLDARDGAPTPIVSAPGVVRSWSAAAARIAFAFRGASSPAELFVKPVRGADKKPEAIGRALTRLNAAVLADKSLGKVEAFTFASSDGRDVEAFLTIPPGLDPARKYPLIVAIHGGPHSQQGPAFDAHAQTYAARGWATLAINYRGSIGYGQAHADALFGDQNGRDADDVLYGVDAALRRYPWLDADRLGIEGGSYGGQLTNWIITRTQRFKSAVPTGGIANLVSFNYLSSYHDYLAVEFGAYPHQNAVIDRLWERSPIRYAANVTTPTLLIHSQNDTSVPAAESEQFYVALRDAGVEAELVLYPGEAHAMGKTRNIVDALERSVDWHARHLPASR